MKIKQQSFSALPEPGDLILLSSLAPDLLLVLASLEFFKNEALYTLLKKTFPSALLIGGSSAGNIGRNGLTDDSLQITALKFDDPQLAWACAKSSDPSFSLALGITLGEQLAPHSPQHVLLFAHRHNTSAHRLLAGVKKALPGISISGCVVSNPADVTRSYTIDPNGMSEDRCIALAFCSPQIRISNGLSSGWRPFGPTRRVTRSEGNILYELDGESALCLYRRYLGHPLDESPNAWLLYSFELLDEQRRETGRIRAVQRLDHSNGSLVLADDIPNGCYLRLMHASANELINGAEAAVQHALQTTMPSGVKLALVVSCLGRRIVMGQRVEDEIEVITPLFGPDYHIAGLYSRGEFGAPNGNSGECEILNETMGVTLIGEVATDTGDGLAARMSA